MLPVLMSDLKSITKDVVFKDLNTSERKEKKCEYVKYLTVLKAFLRNPFQKTTAPNNCYKHKSLQPTH